MGKEGTKRPSPEPTADDADDTLSLLGAKLRALRNKRGFTLQALASETGLSASMLSMVERGRASPSIGSLVVLAAALGVHMSSLFEGNDDAEPVNRLADQPVVETPEGVTRRLAIDDNEQNIEVVVNEYPPGTASASRPLHHPGLEYGVVLEGVLTIEFDDASYHLRHGDAIGYSSEVPHRIRNGGGSRARALWINVGRQ
jgi:transcriptional regulator with XRE-family HTH domain